MRNLRLTLPLTVLSATAVAGGWVGNGPVNVGYHPTNSFSDLRGEQKNSLLRARNENALGVGASTRTPIVNHTYGLSDDWTLVNLMSLGYNVYSDRGSGHEVAIFAGVPSVGWSDERELRGRGSIGVVHAYRPDGARWQVVNSASVEQEIDQPRARAFARIRSGVSTRITDDWSLGGSVDVLPLVREPSVELTRRFNDSASLSAAYGDTTHAAEGQPPTDVYLMLETSW